MRKVTDKKEIKQIIGDWPTVQIKSNYVLGSNKIELQYGNQSVLFESDNKKDVAYIAMECHAISNDQYALILK